MTRSFTFTHAQTLGPDGWHDAPIHIHGAQLGDYAEGREIDVSGFLLLPGIIDLHGDAFEKHVAPRRGAMNNLTTGFAGIEAELASCGITTAYLAQFFSWEGGMRAPSFAHEFLAARTQYRSLGTDLRVQLRFETHMISEYAALSQLIDMFGIDYVVLNDHLPHAALEAGKKPPRLTGQALRAGRSPEAHHAMMRALHENGDRVEEALRSLLARHRDVTFGSHDDASQDGRRAWHALGVHIAEFPETLEAAEAAKALGDAVVIGAPNAMRGGSHNRNVSAHDLIRAGLIDALASDYHYPSMHLAMRRLVNDGVCDLAQAWALISSGPARVIGCDDRGVIAPNYRADMVIMRQEDMRIMGTMAQGRFTYLADTLAARLL
jgi:alpha-D-ribose 1-methylphosphonate 5-triphosphate diphosphatase